MEAVDAVAGRDALELEVVEAVEIDAASRLGVDAEQARLRAQAVARVHEGAVRELAVRGDAVQRQAHRRARDAERGLERPHQRVQSAGVLQRDEQLDRLDRRPALAVAALGADPGQPHGALDQHLRRAGRGQHAAPARELEAVVPAVAAQRGEVAERDLRRVEPAQIGGHRDRAPARIAVGEPAPDAVEDRARRVGQVQQHLLRRLGRARFGRHQPGLEPRVGALGEVLDPRPLEDLVGAVDRRVGHRIRNQTAHAGDPRERVLEGRVAGEIDAALRERRHAADHRRHQPVPHRRGMLGGEQAQHRALERVAVLEAGDSVVRERGAHQRQEFLADPGAARAQAAHEHAQPGGVRGPEIAGDGRARRTDQQLLDVGERAQLAPDSGQRAAQLRREPSSSGASSSEIRRSTRSGFTS